MAAKNSPPDSAIADPVKVCRLKKRADFLTARKGKRRHEHAFVLQLIRRSPPDSACLRVGFTVTKKNGNAVIRNRIKRRLREAVKMASFSPSTEGCDAVIIARREAETEPFQKLVESITRAFSNLERSDKHNKSHGGVAN